MRSLSRIKGCSEQASSANECSSSLQAHYPPSLQRQAPHLRSLLATFTSASFYRKTRHRQRMVSDLHYHHHRQRPLQIQDFQHPPRSRHPTLRSARSAICLFHPLVEQIYLLPTSLRPLTLHPKARSPSPGHMKPPSPTKYASPTRTPRHTSTAIAKAWHICLRMDGTPMLEKDSAQKDKACNSP